MAAFNISDRDIDALARIAYAEARNIASRTGDLKSAYGSVVESILNRAAANRSHLGGSRVQDVIDHTNHPRYYQFTPIAGTRNKTWSDLPKPPDEVYSAVKSHLRDLQKGKAGVVGDATHYLNPFAPGTAKARSSWARDWESWPVVGSGTVQHRFGNADNLRVPDYTVSYEPQSGFPAPPAPKSNDPAAQYSYYGLTRSLAPSMPVDRDFQTPETVYGKLADTMGAVGIRGLSDVPPATYAAPFGAVERAPLPSIQDIARTKGYQQYGASRAAALQPALPDTIAAPPTLTRSEDYFGPPAAIPRSRPVTPADMPYSVSPRAAPAIDPVTVRATAAGAPSVGVHGTGTTSPMAGFDETVPAVPSVGFPAPPSVPGRDARISAAKGALMGGLRGGPMGALIGAALGPAKDQIIGNIRSNMQGMGRVPVFSGIKDAYRGLFDFGGGRFGGMFSGIPSPNYNAPAFGVGSGYGAIGSVFGAPAGATAFSRSDPNISFTSLGNGYVERSNSKFGTTQTMAPGDYDAGMFSGKSSSKK